VLGVDDCKIDEFIVTLKAKEAAQAEIARLEKAKSASTEVVIVEEIGESDDEYPEGHVELVEELSKLEEISQMISSPRLVEESIGPRGERPETQVVHVEEMSDKRRSAQVTPLPVVGKGKPKKRSK
jgi:hypothetical protein